LLTTLDADFYEFSISNDPNNAVQQQQPKKDDNANNGELPAGELEPIN